MATHVNGAKHANGPSGSKHLSSQDHIDLEHRYAALNYHPLPVVFDRAHGATVFDPEENEYIDFLSAYSAVNQGHAHPRIVQALIDQASKLSLSSRAFHATGFGQYAKKVTELMGFEKVLPANSGVEAVETALKLARKWAYKVKGIPQNEAIILSVSANFHGRTLAVISMSTDDTARNDFGPFVSNIGPSCPVKGEKRTICFDDVDDLQRALDAHGDKVAAFLVEPIQGEAGIIIPAPDYLERCQALCRKHNVLLIVDEIQTGLGRTGKLACFMHNPAVKPDIITLGKALSGGLYPVSAVLSSRAIMDVIQPGEHGSTFGGNPLACAVATAALDVLVDEDMCGRSERLGKQLLADLQQLQRESDGWITEVRGLGLFAAIVLDETKSKRGRGAWELCLLMKSKGVLAKPTHRNVIRLAPPLVISEFQLKEGLRVIRESLAELDVVDVIPGEDAPPEESQHQNKLDD